MLHLRLSAARDWYCKADAAAEGLPAEEESDLEKDYPWRKTGECYFQPSAEAKVISLDAAREKGADVALLLHEFRGQYEDDFCSFSRLERQKL